jgi:hypothetical protein
VGVASGEHACGAGDKRHGVNEDPVGSAGDTEVRDQAEPFQWAISEPSKAQMLFADSALPPSRSWPDANVPVNPLSNMLCHFNRLNPTVRPMFRGAQMNVAAGKTAECRA